jgi:diguanylate cyclase (GGDEF)-like protein/PAS domain S-box-containing protein
MPQSPGEDSATMPPSFVVGVTSLLLFGPHVTTLAATAAIVAQELTYSQRSPAYRRMLLNVATVGVATQAAGFFHQAFGGTIGSFTWPWQAVPIAAAVVAYCFVMSAAVILPPLLARRSLDRSWNSVFETWPNYFIGASIAVGLVEAIHHRRWDILLVATLPLYFAYRAYSGYFSRLEAERRSGDVIESLDEGICVVDSAGRVTLWNDAAERMLGCSRQRVLGCPLVSAVPGVDKTELPKAMNDALKDRNHRTLPTLRLSSAAGGRILQVKILPIAGGVTLVWHDITDDARAAHTLKRNEARLALAAAGANDGLWEWDLRTEEFYFSVRWKAMLGLPGVAGTGKPQEWFERVHADDLASLKAALAAHLSGKTDYFQHEHQIRHEDGTYRRYLCRGLAARTTDQRVSRIAGSLTDTTQPRSAGEQLRGAASLDPLTGLCNRAVFVEDLGRQLEDLKERRSTSCFAVLYLDLDRFKIVNDSLGHLAGDELLIAVSRRLESCLRQGDALARLGGDEFAILLKGLSDEPQANAIAFRIQEALGEAFSIGGREAFTSASIGIAFGLAQYESPDEIMRDADTAMYHAKSRGKARHEVFDADMHERARDRLGLESDLRRAVQSNDFEVHYQPIVFLASGMCVGFESLIRWTRNEVPISPATFIPMAEELGLIEPLGTWVLQQACSTFADWQRRFPDGRLEYITVNVSSRQLMQPNFLRIVEQAVQKARLKPSDLRLEITETALMESPNLAAGMLRELRDFGVKIYLDDFGTGYSSLSHLHKLPVDALKIDRSFVRSLVLPDRPAIVESILALARTLNTSVVAEGIETDVQAHELERLGCTHAQGFLFSRPLSAHAAEQLIVANRPLGPKQTVVEDIAV